MTDIEIARAAKPRKILDIAKAEHMSMDVAVNMFLANVKNAGDSSLPHYKGADHVDYAALKPHVKELEESWPAFRETFEKYQKEIIALRKEGVRFAFAEE